MKKIVIKLLILSGVFILFNSCTKDLLDKKPISSLPAEGFYENIDDARGGIYGIYNAVQGAFRINFAYWGEGRAGNVKTTHSGDVLNLIQNNLNDAMSSASWINLYNIVSRVNYDIKCIRGIENGGDKCYKEQLVGKARALRALPYLYLVSVWGDGALIVLPYTSTKQELFV